MLVNAYRGLSLTVEQLAAATNTNKGRFTPFYAYNILNDDGTVKERVPGLFDMLEHYSIRAAWTNNATFDFYQAKWADGYPVIALVDYASFSDNRGYTFAHFLIATGTRGDDVITFDPLRATGPTTVPIAEFKRAIATRSRHTTGTNEPHQAMFPLKPLIASLYSDRVQAVASSIRLAVS
jgi:hypothetical protein